MEFLFLIKDFFGPQVSGCQEVSHRPIIHWRVFRIRHCCLTREVYPVHRVQYRFILGQRVRFCLLFPVELHISCRKLGAEDITASQLTQHQQRHNLNRPRDSLFHNQAWEVLGTVKARIHRVAEPQVCSRSIHIKKKTRAFFIGRTNNYFYAVLTSSQIVELRFEKQKKTFFIIFIYTYIVYNRSRVQVQKRCSLIRIIHRRYKIQIFNHDKFLGPGLDIYSNF